MALQKKRPRQKKKTLHMAPGSIVIDPDSPMSKLLGTYYDEHHATEKPAASVAELRAGAIPGGVLWGHVTGLGDQHVIEQLRDEFKLHRLAVEDVVSLHQRPKAEDYENHLYVVIHMPQHVDGMLRMEQISIFLGDGWLLTFEERPPHAFEPVRDRIRGRKGIVRDNKTDYLAYALIDCVLDGFFPVLESYCDRMEELEGQILACHHGSHVKDVHNVKQELLALRRTLWPTRDMLSLLLRNEKGRFGPTALIHLRDCLDHANQLIDLVEVYRELANDLMNLHLMNASIRQNEVMKVLTIVSAIFIPLSFIAGVYGMNFDPEISPWNMPELRWAYGYPMALGLMLLVAGALLAYMYSRGWMKRD